MKRLIYQVALGKRRLYDACGYSVSQYAKRIGADYKRQTEGLLRITPDPFLSNRSPDSIKPLGYLPIYEKENALGQLHHYDQVAVIDADVYVSLECNESIFDEVPPSVALGAVIESDLPLTEEYRRKLQTYSKMQYGQNRRIADLFTWDKHKAARFFNVGVMVVNKRFLDYMGGMTPRQWLLQPRFKPFIDGLGAWKWSTDQTLLNVFIKEEKVPTTSLPYKWNFLYGAADQSAIEQANFLHFFLSAKLKQGGDNIESILADLTVPAADHRRDHRL